MDGREIKVSLAHRAVGVLICNARLHHRVVERRLSGSTRRRTGFGGRSGPISAISSST